MHKIILQLNGEPMKLSDKDYNSEMRDSVYEIEMQIDKENLNILENVLERVIDRGDIFNYNIVIIKQNTPICPNCNIEMKLNEADSGKYHKTWSCSECGLSFSKG